MTSVPRTLRHAHERAGNSRVWWIALALVAVVGLVLWLLGVPWGAALPGISLLGFVVRAWLDVGPIGGHVHDTGLSAYGVSDPPRIDN